VEVLQKLPHAHIVQAVGTYVTQGAVSMSGLLCILLYPATEYNLDTFIEVGEQIGSDLPVCLKRFFQCLANALDYLHNKAIKHMDIKPQNLLIRDMRASNIEYDFPYKIYVADFGISRSYPSIVDSQTDSRTSFTRKYAAPEVVMQDSRGLSADVFSLGCVYG
jgi:serine/threonine protein kinase